MCVCMCREHGPQGTYYMCAVCGRRANTQYTQLSAALLNGTWQIYRFPNGNANLTSSHAARGPFCRSVSERGGIMYTADIYNIGIAIGTTTCIHIIFYMYRYINTYTCRFIYACTPHYTQLRLLFLYILLVSIVLFVVFFTPVTCNYCYIFADIPPVTRTDDRCSK